MANSFNKKSLNSNFSCCSYFWGICNYCISLRHKYECELTWVNIFWYKVGRTVFTKWRQRLSCNCFNNLPPTFTESFDKMHQIFPIFTDKIVAQPLTNQIEDATVFQWRPKCDSALAYAAVGLCARGVINDTIVGTAEAENSSGWGHTKGQLISEQIWDV